MRRVRRAALVLAALACAPAPPSPRVRVVGATPSAPVPPDAVEVELTFSGPVDAAALASGAALALCRREDVRAVVTAADAEGGLAAHPARLEAAIEVAGEGTRARVRPAAPLEPSSGYAAVLSRYARAADGRTVLDPEGKSRTFVHLFDTGPAVDRDPPRPRWLLPPHGPIAPDAAELRVGFDGPVTGALALPGGSARAVGLDPDVLGLELLAALAPGELRLDLGAVHDAGGNPALPLEPLEVSACVPAAPAVLALRAAGEELGARVEGEVAGMGRLVAEVSALPGEPACGAAPEAPGTATFRGDVAPCPGWDPCAATPARCPASVRVAGLCPGRRVRVRAAAEDLARRRSAPGGWAEVATAAPVPRPVLTEVLADADAPEAGGEYVELANLGTGDADLRGLVLAKRTASGGLQRCTLAAREGGAVPPGGHALVVGGAYDGRYALPPGTPLYGCGATALAGGLANDRAPALQLEAADGSVLSSAGIAEPAPRCAAGALQRLRPGAPDATASWGCPGTRTPGACNTGTPAAECPRRPW